MADSSVLLEVRVEGKNIQVVQRQVEELAASVNQVSNSQQKANAREEEASTRRNKSARETYNNQRALINSTLSQGRATAKLASGITSGLVPAYAEIVSNIFAVQQTFSALRRAADLSILKQNLIDTGVEAGRNLPMVAQGLRDITDSALSAKDALQATANATAQGFSTAQLESLARVAKGASAALGRDLTDSLDRLVRGTAKLEPEILDELGIIVRLDDATREYAAQLGKSVTELTAFERQQAFVNAAIEQGEKKFGDIADSTDVNPYNQLAAAFSDLSQTLIELTNNVITPVVKFFSNNKLSLTAAVLAFVQTIGNRLSPTLEALATGATEAIANAAEQAKKLGADLGEGVRKNIDTINNSAVKLPKAFADVKDKIVDGTASVDEMKEGMSSLNRSAGRYKTLVEQSDGAAKKYYQSQLDGITELQDALRDLGENKEAISQFSFQLLNLEAESEQMGAFKTSIEDLNEAQDPITGLKVAFEGIGQQFKAAFTGIKNLGKGFDKGRVGASLYNIVISATSISLRGLRLSAQLAGKALLGMIPLIGPLLIVFDLLKGAFSALVNFFKEGSEKAREVADSFKSMDEIGLKLEDTLRKINDPTSFEATNAILKVRVGLLEQLSQGLRKAAELSEKDKEKLKKKQLNAIRAEIRLEERRAELQERGYDETRINRILAYSIQYTRQLREQADAAKGSNQATREDGILIIDSFRAQIESSETLTNALSNQLPILDEIRAKYIAAKSDEDRAKILKQLDELEQRQRAVLAATENLEDSFSKVRQEATKLTAKSDTIATGFIKSFKEISNQIKVVTDAGEQISDASKQELAIVAAAFRETFKDSIGDIEDNQEALNLGIKELETLEKAIRTAAATQKRLNVEAKKYAEVSKTSSVLAGIQFDLEEKAREAALAGAKAKESTIAFAAQQEIERAKDALANAQKEVDAAEEGSEVRAQALQKVADATLAVSRAQQNQVDATAAAAAETAAIQATLGDEATKTLKVKEAELAGRKRILDLDTKALQVQQTKNKQVLAELAATTSLQRAKTGSEVNAEDRLAAAQQENQLLIDGEAERVRIAKEAIDLEYELLAAKLAFEKSRLEALKIEENKKPEAERSQLTIDNLDAAIGDVTTLESRIEGAQSAAVELVDTTETHNQKLRNTNIELLKEEVRRAKIKATMDQQVALAARYSMLVGDTVAPLLAIQTSAEKVKQIQTDLNALKASEPNQESLAIKEKERELIEAQNEELTAQIDLREKLLENSKQYAGSLINSLKETSKLNSELATLRNTNPFTGNAKSIQEASEIAAREREERIRLAEMEATLKKESMKAEFALLKAKQQLLIAEMAKDGITEEERAVIEATNKVLAQTATVNAIEAQNIDKRLQLVKEQVAAEERSARAELATQAGGGIAGVAAIFRDFQANRDAKEEGPTELNATLAGAKKAGEAVAAELAEALENASNKTQAATATAAVQLSESVTKIPAAVVEGAKESLVQAMNSITVQVIKADRLEILNGSDTPAPDTPPAPETPATETPAVINTANEVAEAPAPVPKEAEPVAANQAAAESTTPMLGGAQEAVSEPKLDAPDDSAKILTTAEAWSLAKDSAASYAASLAQFGPEGAAMGAFLQGGLNFAESIENSMEAFKKADDAAGKSQAILQGVGGAIGAIGQMQQAAAAQKVAAIDSEIAAEKARDGKSKESLAKIKALEAKKLATQRKAFEQNKKIQLAQAIVNGMSAIQSGFATQPFFPVGILMGAMAVAMTAMQIKAIQSQTFNGGGGASTPSGPTSISLGQRQTSSDLAKSQSASGELAYMRGADGIGGPENFKPAMMGAKYRATGGPTTGYVVGEQGPELFVPETPGTIMPNNSAPQMQQPTNVNFSINTIDASGVEEVLTAQQGNIIGMIRSAANSYGQNFLEDVDVGSYTQSATGATKY